MKKITFLFLLQFVMANICAQNVTIPDANFKACLLANININTNGDTEIQLSEAMAFTGHIDCPNMNISDLEGIEAFVNITNLSCYNNNLTVLNLEQNTKLEALAAHSNQIISVSLNTINPLLWFINLSSNQLTNFNSIEQSALKILVINSNQLTNLDVTQNALLENLRCDFNQLTTLDISQNPLLYSLLCNNNLLSSLDVTQNPLLFNLICRNNQLINLDLTQSFLLENLDCSYNLITSLNVTNNNVLDELICHKNSLTSLDVSQNTMLTELRCDLNFITNLDVSDNANLTLLTCSSNQLTFLNARNSNNTNFIGYNSQGNPQLSCIIVDDAIYSTTNWTGVDSTSTFVDNIPACNTLSTDNFSINKDVKIYPNSSNSHIIIEYNGSNANIILYNAIGQKIIETTNRYISTEVLNPGIYFAKLDFNKGIVTKKFIIK
ncbi:T9SS type A sorting domain-containing protein [Winogradskyella jejuensis]|uniref:Por secretion system C-terminal sorting domain-containing protein n=1 Tax=Winogradskyella jejuensis TaxID=1089305 RepID=A0A1M5UBW6_9FLAO|nr:T9SS type A sorting domain-containing protein [Winogradskyella jejuensis]SHH60336.1 Por secretion system C-terminal sorting domain-containing protein [Winogradskyella jejuensis]